MHVELGTRIVRGLDWIWGDQDGEEGMLGTVVQIKNDHPPAGSVKVLWDHGGQGMYRCGENNACDLLVFCSPAVSKHGVGCDVCLKDVIGTRWSCKECPLTNLCTTCYMNDKHSLQHAFDRFDASDNEGTPLPARARSVKVEATGFFPGAMVVRGLCWEWDDQDGGDGQVGQVTEIQEFHSKYRRNVARVQWIGNGLSNVYRIGHNGKVDLKCVKPTAGGHYYKHHLPMLGEKSEVIAASAMTARPSTMIVGAAAPNFPMEVFPQGAASNIEAVAAKSISYSNEKRSIDASELSSLNELGEKSHKSFEANDRVRISTQKDIFMTLQSGHGGWNSTMADEIGKIGVVNSVTEKGDVMVTMEGSASKMALHPQVLKKVLAPKILKEGDSIKILSDIDIAKKSFALQIGEWNEEIAKCIGQIGKITKSYVDGNYRVVVGHSSVVIPGDFIDEKVEQLPAGDSVGKTSEVSNEIKIVQAAKGGDLQELKDMLDANPQDVNTPSLDGTPLNAAIFEEREDIVSYLINKGADVNVLDKNKHTALHHALSVGNEEIIKIVTSSKRLDTTILAGKSNLDYLQFASVCGSLFGTEILFKLMSNQMMRPSSGPSPLHFAVISNLELVKFLVNEAGYDVNSRDLDQRTPLHIAIMTSNLATAIYLIQSGAEINASDMRGNSALHMTISSQDRQSLREHVWYCVPLKRYVGKKDQLRIENKQIIKKLLEELDLKKTWLSNDVVFGCYLVKNGADISMKNANGSTALAACPRSEVLSAVKKYHERYVNYLRREAPENRMQSISSSSHSNENQYCSISSEGSLGYQECRLCRQNGTDACFEPCGHIAVCLDCAGYFCKCFICEEDILSFSKKVDVSDCLICDEKIAEVLFEPCKHVVCCSACAWRMAKCVHCKTEIRQKFDKNMQPLTAPNDADSVRYDDLLASLKNLEAKVKEIESVNTCTICLDRQKNVMFLCGHGTCDICSPSLEMCPICRDPIEKKIPMF